MKPTPRIYRSDNARDVADFHKRVVDHIVAILDGKKPPNKLQVPPPKTVAEVFGFPLGTRPFVTGQYIGGRMRRHDRSRTFRQRRCRELADLKRRARIQQIRFEAARRKGQPSPRAVARFVASTKPGMIQRHQIRRRGGEEAADHFKKTRSRIYDLLAVHRDCRRQLEGWRKILLISLEGRRMEGDRQLVRAVVDEIDRLLADTSPDAG